MQVGAVPAGLTRFAPGHVPWWGSVGQAGAVPEAPSAWMTVTQYGPDRDGLVAGLCGRRRRCVPSPARSEEEPAMHVQLPADRQVTVGVDTHADQHVGAALDPLGRLLGTQAVPSTAAGAAAAAFADWVWGAIRSDLPGSPPTGCCVGA